MYIYTNDDNEVIMTNIDKMEQVDGIKEYQLDIDELPTFESKEYYIAKVLFDGINFTAKYILDDGKANAAKNDVIMKLAKHDYRNQKVMDAMFLQIVSAFEKQGIKLELPYPKDEILETINKREKLREKYRELEKLN